MEFIRIANIDCLIKRGKEGSPTFVILHGYGANYEDLAPLATFIDAPKDSTWIFPNGPLEVPIGLMMTGRAWFPIDMEEMEKAIQENRPRIFADKMPPGFLQASGQVSELVREIDVKYEDLYLGGFSQGAMIACDVALHLERKPKGLILWSPTLVAEERWAKALKTRKGLPVFLSHGKSDPLLPFSQTEKLNQMMWDNDLLTKFAPFEGQHEIPMPVIESLNEFLND